MYTRLSQLALMTLTLGASTTAALASSTNFGDFEGTTVIYEDVLEVNSDLFTAPQISGNTLDFTDSISQSNFEARVESGGSDRSDRVSSQLNAFIQARPGQSIETFDVEVTGDSTLAGGGNSVARALLGVTARIIDVAGVEVEDDPLILTPIEVTLAEFVSDTPSGTFDTSTLVSVADAAEEQFSITDPITRVLWSITLTLEAESDTGFSRIDLNSFDSFTVTVPEPASVALFGVAGCFILRRRR